MEKRQVIQQNIIIGCTTFFMFIIFAFIIIKIHEKKEIEYKNKILDTFVMTHVSNINIIIKNIDIEFEKTEKIYSDCYNRCHKSGEQFQQAVRLSIINNDKKWKDAMEVYFNERFIIQNELSTNIDNNLLSLADSLSNEIYRAKGDLDIYMTNYLIDDHELNDIINTYKLDLNKVLDMVENIKQYKVKIMNLFFYETRPDLYFNAGYKNFKY